MKECPISDTENREKIAIVVVGYDRLASTRRLLDSLATAVYETDDVPLVVSIDCAETRSCTDMSRISNGLTATNTCLSDKSVSG